MEKLNFRTIAETAEIDIFMDKVEQYTNVRLPKDYMKRAKVIGIFLHGRLVAGYMLVIKPDFRCLMFLPDKIRNSGGIHKIDQFEMMEVNGLWIGPALKTPILQMRVWLHLIKDIFMCKKRYILLMRNSRNHTMERFLSMANPIKLFHGPSMQMAGNPTHSSIEVSYTTRWKIVLNSHKYLRELMDRISRAKKSQLRGEPDRAVIG